MVVTQKGVCIAAGQAAGGPQVGVHPHILMSCIKINKAVIAKCRTDASKAQEGCMEAATRHASMMTAFAQAKGI